MRTFLNLAVAFTFVFGTVSAAAHSGKGYADAGCGLGAIAFGEDNTAWKQVLAVTTNGTGMNTFAISSGTSRCGGSGATADVAKAFVETNREAFAKDASRASGETISSLSSLAGCKDTKAVGRTLQREFKQIFPSASVADTKVSENVIRMLKAHKELSCKNLS